MKLFHPKHQKSLLSLFPFLSSLSSLLRRVGQKAYVCLQCYRSFEVPNQLKLHLARNCDQFDENVLWKRLQNELLTRHQRRLMMHQRNFEMLNPYHPALMQQLPSSSRRFSAFQPVINKCESSPSPPATLMPLPNLSPVSQSSLNESALAAAAHLETLVSNMGTSKQGHLCIYCGKLYSRKYGLKIHIRTHTGSSHTCFRDKTCLGLVYATSRLLTMILDED